MTLRSLVLAALVLGSPAAGVEALRPPRPAPCLLLHDWFRNSPAATPAYVRDHLEYLESLPFDGVALYLRTPDLGLNVTAGVLSERRLTYEQISQVLKPLAQVRFRTLVHNFAAVVSLGAPDLFDDWEAVIRNFALLAQACKEFQLEGIYFDNENYGRRWADYPSGVAQPRRTLEDYQNQARLRGSQIMQAMTAVFPELVIIVLHGPYVSEPKAPHPLFPSWEHANRLQGPFFVGLVDGAGPRGRCVDGGELYHLRSAEDFRLSYEWRKTAIASAAVDCPWLTDAARKRWADTVEVAFGLYDRPARGAPMDTDLMRSSAALALAQTDRYVWLYVEGPTFLRPPAQGGASLEWIEALRKGKAEGLKKRSR